MYYFVMIKAQEHKQTITKGSNKKDICTNSPQQ